MRVALMLVLAACSFNPRAESDVLVRLDARPRVPQTPDASDLDATAHDAAMHDGSEPDARPLDAAIPDAAAVPDARPPDAAVPDAAVPDAAVPDAAPALDAAIDASDDD